MKQGVTRPHKMRCAIYTRKSTEEGLEQDFNTLDAQREACEAYILSQLHEGWEALPDFYDDGGFSGGSMERPALKRLLGDMEDGRIDVVVVYKVDRLTRSLADFARIVDIMDAKDASFVSVTQAFTTTTSMGRLTLNVLLSFAQFEREVTGERIRDKIAASKKKGMWMGGLAPLGLDAKERKLVVNEPEAEAVRHIYRSYLTLGSVDLLRRTLETEGVMSKVRIDRHGQRKGGNPLARGALYHMLQNRLYLGQIPHRDQYYPGEHAAIIDQVLWDQVQATLSENRGKRITGANSKVPSLLAGLLHDETGRRMTPSHAVRRGKRYRYYVSTPEAPPGDGLPGKPMRLPAGDIERLVQNRIRLLLSCPQDLHAALEHIQIDAGDLGNLIRRAAEIANGWPDTSQHETRARLASLRPRIEVHSSEVRIVLKPSLLLAHLNGSPGREIQADGSGCEKSIDLTVKARLRRSGIGTRLHIEGSRADPDPALVNLIVKAHQLKNQLLENHDLSLTACAKRAGHSGSWFTRMIRLTWLAPDITKAILEGRQPPEFTARQLMLDTRLPLDWQSQRAKLGFKREPAEQSTS